MGCDIHLVLEKRHNGKWIGVNPFDSIRMNCVVNVPPNTKRENLSSYFWWAVANRNYALFGELAGVRGEPSTHREPNGIPDDASDLARMEIDVWGRDGHSHSHLSVKTFAERWLIAHDQTQQLVEDKLSGGMVLLARTVNELFNVNAEEDGENLDDYRVIFWFDN